MSKELISTAVEPMRMAAVESIKSATRVYLESFAEKLLGTDLEQTASYPRGTLNKAEYMKQLKLYNIAVQIMIVEENVLRRHRDPRIAVGVNTDSINHLVEQSARDAESDFNAYVSKLVAKVGDGVISAVANNKNFTYMWTDSDLVVEKEDGSKEVWNTKRIVNHSKFGLPFNQWPTRKVK